MTSIRSPLVSDARLAADVFIAPGAQIYGDVSIAERCSVWPNAIVRAEAQHVEVGRVSNLQDLSMIHIGYEHPTRIGAFCSITHQAIVHGAVVEDCCLIGIHAVIMDGAVIGRGSIVAPGAIVREGTRVPSHSIVAGVPAKVMKQRDSERENRLNAWQYHRNARAYACGDHRAWDGAAYLAWLDFIRAEIASDRDLAPGFDPRVD